MGAPPEDLEELPARRWPRRLMLATCIVAMLSVLATAGGWGYLRWRFDQIEKRNFAKGLLSDEEAGKPMNVLLVGSDTRANLSGEAAAQAGKALVGGQRSDTIMVLHVDPEAKQAALMSIPRDIVVDMPGTKRKDRIFNAFETGGADLLLRTVRESLDIDVHHYAQVDFVGFKGIVDIVGGVDIYVPTPARDVSSGLAVPTAGCVHFDGEQALAWARSRQFEYYESGRWRTDESADLGRIQRQQELLRRLMSEAQGTGIDDPVQLNRLIGTGIKFLQIDSELSSKDIVRLARRFRSLDPESVEMITLANDENVTRSGEYNGQKLVQPEAQQQIDRINGKPPVIPTYGGPPIDQLVRPDQVRVRVLNGTGGNGLATEVATEMSAKQFNVADKGDAENFRFDKTVVRYATGQGLKGGLVKSYLQGEIGELREDPTLSTVDVALVVGSDYTGLRVKSGTDANASTTTAPTAPTTTVPPAPTAKGVAPKSPC